MLGVGEIIVIAAVVLLALNARLIPELASSVAKTIQGVRDGLRTREEEDDDRPVKDLNPPKK